MPAALNHAATLRLARRTGGLIALVAAAGLLAVTPVGAASANQLGIAIPGPTRAGSAYNVIISGSAAGRATVYLFVDYARCAGSLSAERRRSGGQSDSYSVRGVFSEVSGWQSSSSGLDHACGYLVDRAGHLLASANRVYRVG
jgi:hypothetical protein